MNNRFRKCLIFAILFSLRSVVFSQHDFDSQIKEMSDTLANRLIRSGKTRIIVSNFVDLKENTTELGKYIAEAFSVELSNKPGLIVIDRSRFSTLMEELKLNEKKLTKPENVLKLGEMAGVEYIITGTTVPLEKSVDITIKALDIQNGVSIAGQRGSVPRTDAINNLMNSTISGSNSAANVSAGRKIEVESKSAADVIFEVGITELRDIECEIKRNGFAEYYGQVCFENQTGEDILFIPTNALGPGGDWIRDQTLIPKSGRNCSSRIRINDNGETSTKDVIFMFYSVKDPKKTGTFRLTIEKCKLKSVILSSKNLFLKS